jgi:hypothetical protein
MCAAAIDTPGARSVPPGLSGGVGGRDRLGVGDRDVTDSVSVADSVSVTVGRLGVGDDWPTR